MFLGWFAGTGSERGFLGCGGLRTRVQWGGSSLRTLPKGLSLLPQRLKPSQI